LPSMSERVEISEADAEETEDLPPHRAAIPVPPMVLNAERMSRRRNLVSLAIVFSLALHAGVFAAALIWGQGEPLPDADSFTAVIRVQVAEIGASETVIEKAPALSAESPATALDNATPSSDETAAPVQPAVIADEQPSPAELAAEIEAARPSRAIPQAEDVQPAPELTIQAQETPSSPEMTAEAQEAPPAPEVTAEAQETPPPPEVTAEAQGAPPPPEVTDKAQEESTLAEMTVQAREEPAPPEQRRLAALGEGQETADVALASTPEKTPEGRSLSPDSYKPPNMRHKGREGGATSSLDDDGARLRRTKTSSSRSAIFSYKRRVRARVIRNLPEGRWGPGRVVVGFRLSNSGRLLSSYVMRSSGLAGMDQAALACVRRAGPFPAPPPGATAKQLALSIDFRFR
jgi:periplasmic protein TonB